MASEKRRSSFNTVSKPTFKEKFDALGNLPRFFKLVWQTHKGYTLLDILLRIVRSALPVAILYVGKLIIDNVVFLSKTHQQDHTFLWQMVAAEFGLAILSDALGRATLLVDSLLGDLFSNYTSVEIMKHAATLDLDQFEDSEFYDKLERARQQTIGRTVLLSQVLTQVQDFITMGFLAAGLMAFNPWLILLLLVAIVPAFLGESYFNDRNVCINAWTNT
jgi:ATP-binding cassette subfamily B protein